MNNKRLISLFLLFLSATLQITALAQEAVQSDRPTLKGGVSSLNYLPPDLYGSWSVTAYLQSTTHPEYFNTKTSEIWELKQVGDNIILSNPLTGASASITVNEVTNNTATFTRSVDVNGRILSEKPIITVNNDVFTGITHIKIEKNITGVASFVARAVYRLEASKLSGPTLKIFDSIPSQSD